MSEVASTGQIEIGRVIQQLVGVLRRNIGPFLGLVVVLNGVPLALIALAGASKVVPLVVLAILLGVAGYLILLPTLIHAATTDLKGEPVSLSASLRAGASQFVGVFVIALLSSLGIGLGSVLLLVPGFILATMWSVAVPSYLNEPRVDIMDSFGRSAELTRGNRWSVFGLLVLGMVFSLACQFVLFILARAVSGGAGTGAAIALGVVNIVVNVVFILVFQVGAATLYAELRRAKGGFGTEALAEVFA